MTLNEILENNKFKRLTFGTTEGKNLLLFMPNGKIFWTFYS